MKKIKFILIAFILLGSCKNFDFGDVNNPPINPTEPSPKDLLAGGIMNFFNNSGRSYFTNPTFYVQWLHQNFYTSEMRYADQPIDWSPWFIQVLSNFQTNIKYIEANKDNNDVKALGDPDNQIAVNKIMKAYIFKFVTDIYGDIPFSEALDENNHFPKYDNQIDIYKGIISMLKEARDQLDPNAGELTLGVRGDVVYGRNFNEWDNDAVFGDAYKANQILQWKKLANSLILHAALQLSKADPAYAQTEFQSALNDPAGVIEDVEDEAWIEFVMDNRAWRNPFSRLRRSDYYLTKELTDHLQGNPHGLGSNSPTYNHTSDARELIISTGGAGKPYDDITECDDEAQISSKIWNPTAPLPFFTAAWTYLDRAEAAALGWTGESYDDMLTQGIIKSYESLSVHYGVDITGDANTYAAARVADANDATYGGGTINPKLRVVGEEKWIAYFPMGFEEWAQWRRMNVPELTPISSAINSHGQIPRRYRYPSSEQTFNGEHWQQAVNDLDPQEDNNEARIPWDQ